MALKWFRLVALKFNMFHKCRLFKKKSTSALSHTQLDLKKTDKRDAHCLLTIYLSLYLLLEQLLMSQFVLKNRLIISVTSMNNLTSTIGGKMKPQ